MVGEKGKTREKPIQIPFRKTRNTHVLVYTNILYGWFLYYKTHINILY